MPLMPIATTSRPVPFQAAPAPIPFRRDDAPRSLDAAEDGPGRLEAKKAKLREAARGFEAVFLRQLITEMRKTLDGEGLFGSGAAGEIYSDLLGNAMAESAAKRGPLGIGDDLYRRLVVRLEPEPERPITAQAGPG